MKFANATVLQEIRGSQGSAVQWTSRGNVFRQTVPDFLPRSTGHSRMKFVNAINLHKKSGEAQ